MEGLASRMRFAAMAFAVLIVVGTLILVGEEDSDDALVRTAQGYFDQGGNEPRASAAAPTRDTPIEPYSEPVEYVESDTALADDEMLIDDTLGIDAEGYDPSPTMETDHDADAVDEMIIVDESDLASE